MVRVRELPLAQHVALPWLAPTCFPPLLDEVVGLPHAFGSLGEVGGSWGGVEGWIVGPLGNKGVGFLYKTPQTPAPCLTSLF
jgi:hypothetical protein